MSIKKKVVVHAKQIERVFQLGDTEVHALRGIDLEIYEGEFIVILGSSICTPF